MSNFPPPPPPPNQPPGMPPPYGAPPPVGVPPYADWSQRALALLIDIAPIFGISIINAILQMVMPTVIDFLLVLVVFAAIIGWVGYNYGIQQGTTGYTLGKGVVGIKLVSEPTGQPVGTGMAVARYFVHFIDAIPCYVGYLWPLWDDKKQTFTDKVLTQIVIKAPKA